MHQVGRSAVKRHQRGCSFGTWLLCAAVTALIVGVNVRVALRRRFTSDDSVGHVTDSNAAAATARTTSSSSFFMRIHGLSTAVGITLDPERAPRHCAAVDRVFDTVHWLQGKHEHDRRVANTTSNENPLLAGWFTRAEPVPKPSQPADGPPYGLLQGGLPASFAEVASLPQEIDKRKRTIRPGDLVRIANRDFFVSLQNHDAWAHSFTVFGHVTSAADVKTLANFTERLDTHVFNHPQHGTAMRLLNRALHFRMFR